MKKLTLFLSLLLSTLAAGQVFTGNKAVGGIHGRKPVSPSGPATADPNGIQAARDLLGYLNSLANSKVISGQDTRNTNLALDWTDTFNNTTHYPGIMGTNTGTSPG